jgi:hypothetical protein
MLMFHECYKIALFCGLSPPLDKSQTEVTVCDSNCLPAWETPPSRYAFFLVTLLEMDGNPIQKDRQEIFCTICLYR